MSAAVVRRSGAFDGKRMVDRVKKVLVGDAVFACRPVDLHVE
jgi:hypothetical protein